MQQSLKVLEGSLTTCSRDPKRMTENMMVYFFRLKKKKKVTPEFWERSANSKELSAVQALLRSRFKSSAQYASPHSH